MTPRDRVINTVFHQASAPIPSLLTIPEDVYAVRREECDELRVRFASDLEFVDHRYHFTGEMAPDALFMTDAWGCFWLREPGGEFRVEADAAPLADVRELAGVVIPENPVTRKMLDKVTARCDRNPRFVVVQSAIRPLSRLQALLGRDQVLEAIRRDAPELRHFLKRLHAHYLEQLQVWCATDADAVCLGDDWADEDGLFSPAGAWTELFQPMMAEYCEILRAHDKFAYFTSPGDIQELVPHLIAAGVDVVRYDGLAVSTENLAYYYGGKMAFHVVLDVGVRAGEGINEISRRILSMRRALGEQGGMIAECRMSADAPLRNVSGAMLNFRRRMPLEM